MPLTKLEQELRPVARERIAKGQLPRYAPSTIWGGYGSGNLCSLCDQPIERDQIEYEIEDPGEHAASSTYRFHMVCQSIWQLECARDEYLRIHSTP
jgi:hypothetical protein